MEKYTLRQIFLQIQRVLEYIRRECNPEWGGDMDYISQCEKQTNIEIAHLEKMIHGMQE